MNPKVAFIDVDDTLIRSVGAKEIPVPPSIKKVKELHAEGWVLYCWSSGGAEFAQRTAESLGIASCFKAYLPKPNLMLDDMEPSNWPDFKIVHPSQL
jgi:hypothetical protein